MMDYLSDLASHKPSGWNLIRNKAIFSERKEVNTSYGEEDLLSVSEYYGVKPRKAKISDGEILNRADSLEKYRVCHPNDLVMNIMLAWKGSMGVSQYKGIVSPAYSVFAVNADNVSPRFFEYLFQTSLYTSIFKRYSTGIIDSRLRLYPDVFLGLYSLIPSKHEQMRIVEYLDQKCSQIDSLIAVEEAQIEKLKEYKQAVITETVTKGLDKNVPMVNSGVKWIGMIPKKWRIVSTKSIFDIIAGATPESGNKDNWDGNICWITPADYKTEDVFVGKGRRNISQLGYDSCSTTLIPAGNIIFSKRAPIGLVAINERQLCTNQGCLSCIPKKDVSIKYFYYQISSYRREYEVFGSGTTFKEISALNFGLFKLVLPPLEDQENMAKFLDYKTLTVSKIISIKMAKIEKLSEYKKSLIYEYVTGKKEVMA